MKSVLEAARKSGYNLLPVKVSDIGKAVKLNRPFSLTKMCVRPAFLEYKETIHNEELETSFTFTINSSGEWIFAGYVADHSNVFGYAFELQVAINFVDENGRMACTPRIEGYFGQIIFAGNHRLEFEEQGYDPFIVNNWNRLSVHEFKSAFTRKVQATQIIATVLVIPALIALVAATPFILSGFQDPNQEKPYVIKPYLEQSPDVDYKNL